MRRWIGRAFQLFLAWRTKKRYEKKMELALVRSASILEAKEIVKYEQQAWALYLAAQAKQERDAMYFYQGQVRLCRWIINHGSTNPYHTSKELGDRADDSDVG